MYSSVVNVVFSNLICCCCLLVSCVNAVLINIEQYKGEIQRTHNLLRARQNAADMKYMFWDRSLEARAAAWSERCVFAHQMRGFGENLAFTSSTGPTPRPGRTIREGMINWYNEIRLWLNRSPQQRRQFCGAACHYTQMVWSRTSRLGCTLSYCPVLRDDRGQQYQNAMYFVCFYYPQGNIIGQDPFIPGPPCSRCPSGPEPCLQNLCAGQDGNGRRRRSVTESWLCHSPKLSCSTQNVAEKCPQKCSLEKNTTSPSPKEVSDHKIKI